MKSTTKSMNLTRFVLLLSLALLLPLAGAQENKEKSDATKEMMEDLGDQRYRIGTIVVDRKAQSFSVPGKILHLKDPLEYLAVSSNGMKAYESLFELETSPREFNLACILLGLDETKAVKPRYQFDERKPKGQAVSITVSWLKDGRTVSVSGARAMTAGDETFEDDSWVYIGSATSEDGQQFHAEAGGTLIGFVHDPYSIIDHVNGGGIGDYGLLTGDGSLLPPEGSPITLRVSVGRK